MPASDPRLSSLRPVLEYQPRASLANRQPAWESGLAQRILAEKMGGEGKRILKLFIKILALKLWTLY